MFLIKLNNDKKRVKFEAWECEQLIVTSNWVTNMQINRDSTLLQFLKARTAPKTCLFQTRVSINRELRL